MRVSFRATAPTTAYLIATGKCGLPAQSATANVLYSAALFAGLSLRMIGPARGGRATTAAGIAELTVTVCTGATGGGVWKTCDYGQSWAKASDGYFETASIAAIQSADSDLDTVYVSTGTDGIRSNVITGLGIYRSNDPGRTRALAGLRDVDQIGAVEVHPRNPDMVQVTAIGHSSGPNSVRGVCHTLDGGATWDQVLFPSDGSGAVDLEFAPDNPQEVYASMRRAERKPWTIISGAYEGGMCNSSDGGETWTELTNGLPPGLRRKSDLAVSRSDPDRVYVLYEAREGEGGLYRSYSCGRATVPRESARAGGEVSHALRPPAQRFLQP